MYSEPIGPNSELEQHILDTKIDIYYLSQLPEFTSDDRMSYLNTRLLTLIAINNIVVKQRQNSIITTQAD